MRRLLAVLAVLAVSVPVFANPPTYPETIPPSAGFCHNATSHRFEAIDCDDLGGGSGASTVTGTTADGADAPDAVVVGGENPSGKTVTLKTGTDGVLYVRQVDASGYATPAGDAATRPVFQELSDGTTAYTAAKTGQLPTALGAHSALMVEGVASGTSIPVSNSDLVSLGATVDTPGTTVPATGVVVAGSDGTNTRFILTDSSGRPIVVGAGTAGAAAGGVITVQGSGSGTPVPVSVASYGTASSSICATTVQTVTGASSSTALTLPTCASGSIKRIDVCSRDGADTARVSFGSTSADAGFLVDKKGDPTSCITSGDLASVTQAQACTTSGCGGTSGNAVDLQVCVVCQ